MADNKTVATTASVEDYLAAIEDHARQADCRALAELMGRLTGQPAVMWGESMVGFGRYHYKYASGREGDSFLAGFSSRKSDLTVYIACGLYNQGALLEKLGKHKAGKGCLYLRRLSDVDPAVLEQLILAGMAEAERLYG